jgi:hypothetical protein
MSSYRYNRKKDLNVHVLVTGFSNVGVSRISQSLKQDKVEKDWYIVCHVLSKDENLPERIDVGNFDPELVIVVTDSTPENVEQSHAIVKIMKKQFPEAFKIAIANMQKLPERLQPEDIEELLGLTTYGRQ